MHGDRLSAAEKGKQKAADEVVDLPPAALVLDLESAGEPRRPAAHAAAANWHAGGLGVPLPRHLLLVPPSGTSEIEEAPPSPPPAAPSRPDLPALSAADAAAAAELAGRLKGRVMELQATLEGRLRELEQLQRWRERDADEPSPEVTGGAGAQALQHQLAGTMQQERVSGGMKDAMLAFRLQAEEMQAWKEFWKAVVPATAMPHPQRKNSKAELEEMKKALEEFWKPVPQRNNNKRKINWKRVISLIALASGLVPYISFWTLLPVINNLIHIVGTISVLWILRSTYSSCCQRFRTSRTISRHVPRLIYVCFWLLVLYVLYLILRPIHGAFIGLLGKHQ